MSRVPQRLGHYELRQQLGRGNVGEVWKGYDAQLQRDVAIKIIYIDLQSDPNFLTRFAQQGQKITSLHHPNIVQVHDVAINHQPQSPDTTYIVSDYIESHTLSEYMAAKHHEGTIPPLSDIVYLFTSLGVAIDYAHQKGVVHGNIKPSNILLDKRHATHFMQGEPMLTDFGLALLLGEEVGIGTPHYMSPEQVKGDPTNNRSDIYSLGVILYELCTGVQPFRDESSVAVMMQHINILPTPPLLINPQLPPALSQVILRAMAKDTATRFPMASLLATAIADACSIRPTLSIPRVAVVEEEGAYHTGSGQYGSFLGVPQPLSPPSSHTRPLSQPMPRIHPRMSLPSQPLPAITQHLSSPHIPTISAKPAAIQPTQTPTGALVTNNLPAISTPPIPSSTTSAKVAVPAPQAQYSGASHMPTFSPSTERLINTPSPAYRKSSRSHLTDVPMYAVLLVCAVILVIAAGIIGNLLLNAKGQPGSITGHVFFQDDALGHADMLRIDMQNISAPPQGKTYQAWLQDTTHHTLPLGSLALSNDTATLLYPGDAEHTNLLSIAQGVIVTLEDIASKSSRPTGDTLYKATFDAPSFQYIKNILYKTPDFPANDGVIVGLFETIKSMNDKAGSIVDSIQGTQDYALARRQAIRIIELTDGTEYSMVSGDLPKNTPSYVYARVGLISSPTQPGYIDTLSTQLDKLQQAAGNNSTLLTHIQNVRNAVADLRAWVQQIRTYDVQLVKAKHLSDPALLNIALQLKQMVADFYTGRTIPPDEGPKPTPGSAGAYQAYVESQYLTTLDLKHV